MSDEFGEPSGQDRAKSFVVGSMLSQCIVWSILCLIGEGVLFFSSSHYTVSTIDIALVAAAIVGIVVGFPSRLTIGADGIRVASLVHRRFFPYREIVELNAWRRHVSLLLADGRKATLIEDISNQLLGGAASTNESQRAAIYALALERLEAWRATANADLEHVDPLANMLSASADEPAGWVAALREVAARSATYRAQAFDATHLEHAMADPVLHPTKRAAAAYVLAKRSPEDASARIRVVAQATADAELRAALESIAGGHKEDSEDALIQLAKRRE